jgi:multiple sugar transport system permease protein
MIHSNSTGTGNRVVHIALFLTAVIVLAPFLWVLSAGFRTQISLLTGELTFTPTLRAFSDVLFAKTSDFVLNFRNSLVVGLISTGLCLIIATLAAWSLHRMRWPAWVTHSFLGWALVFNLIPPITLAGGWFMMFRAVGLENSFTGLVLAHVTLNLPISIWLMGVFVRDVPEELIEAARVDGATTATILSRIVTPIVTPGLAATGVLVFVFSWNEFAVSLNLSMRQTATVPVAIAKFAQDFDIQYTQMAASAALSVIPAVLLLLFGQRFIVKGLTAGAVK